MVGEEASVGPFSYLRPGTILGKGGKIGAFVETKNATIGDGAKVPHLAYCGDAVVDDGANIGAGTIFANYDGIKKSTTHVGKNAFVGSNSVLVAPVDVGERAMTGAGAIVRRGSRIGAGEVWVGVPARKLDRTVDASGGGKS